MATNAFLGGITFARKNTAVSPATYPVLEEVIDLPSIGETAPLVRATHFQSTSEEYIAGLADGDEFTVQCNRVHTGSSEQDTMIGLKGTTITLRITHSRTNVSPVQTKIYTLDVVVLGWSVGPSIDDRNTISYTFKITAGIAIT